MFIPINFGDRVAENEAENLNSYFVETHAWKELYEGKKTLFSVQKEQVKVLFILFYFKKKVNC